MMGLADGTIYRLCLAVEETAEHLLWQCKALGTYSVSGTSSEGLISTYCSREHRRYARDQPRS